MQAGDQVLQADRIIPATSSDPAVPPIDGPAEAGYPDQPRGDPLGGGATGVDLGMFFARLASSTLIEDFAVRPDVVGHVYCATDSSCEVRRREPESADRKAADERQIMHGGLKRRPGSRRPPTR